MAAPPGRSQIEIENAERGYTDAGFGPTADTSALVETPPPFARSRAPAERRGESPTGTPTPNFRAVARKTEDVEKARGRARPVWLGAAIGSVVAVLFLGCVLFLVASRLFATPPAAPPPAAEIAPEAEKTEDLDGIPVRKGLGR